MKIVLYVTTCSKNYRPANLVKQHLDKQGFEYYFVYGRSPELVVEPKIIVDCEEKYNQLSHKTYKLIEHFVHKTDADYLLKIDDDTFIEKNIIPELIFKYDYGGYVNLCAERLNQTRYWNNFKMKEYDTDPSYLDKTNISLLDYVCGGFYFLSRYAAEFIVSNPEKDFINTVETYLGEDKRIGYTVAKNPKIAMLKMNVKTPLDLEIVTDYAVIHPVNPIIFHKLEGRTPEEKYKILEKYDFLNTHNKINDHIEKH